VREPASPLEDFPLHDGAPAGVLPRTAPEPAPAAEPPTATASLGARSTAAAADAATLLLLAAVAILAARFVTGASPRLSGVAWALGFVAYLSFFATVPALVLFGKTVGMALADLSARPPSGAPGLSASAALRRWLGTIATAATAGLLLLWTAASPNAPTPADRLSGRALTVD
jgi:hypothetical protein